MGLEIDRDRFGPADFRRFNTRLEDCLQVLEGLLARPDFGRGAASVGAELEVALVDASARPLPMNLEILEETLDPRMTVELDRFNLECNLRHGPLAGRPFSALRSELEEARRELGRAAALHGGRPVMIGILPTVRAEDLGPKAMTDTPRYRALALAIREARRAPFHLDIDGEDPLVLDCEGVTFEGAATSLQIHLRVDPPSFASLFNAIQIATAPALAAAANSPTFLGHRLWVETRVALFKQAVDERDAQTKRNQRMPRVGFGTHWIREGAFELFREAVDVFPPLLPILDEEDPLACLEAKKIPRLREIRLHQGTVWSWNRPVYDPAEGGHLRIEIRALPSGPTITDMLANTAFILGVAFGLQPGIEALTRRLDFEAAHRNFYRSAQNGLDAELIWPDGLSRISAPDDRIRAADLVRRLVPIARTGLRARGVDPEESDPLLEIIDERARTGRTGAAWQREALRAIAPGPPTGDALTGMLERYITLSDRDQPVHLWPPGCRPGSREPLR